MKSYFGISVSEHIIVQHISDNVNIHFTYDRDVLVLPFCGTNCTKYVYWCFK